MEKEKNNGNSSLCIHLLELVRLRVAQINNCNYCIAMHYDALKYLGDTDVRLSLLPIWNKVPYFSKKEMALLALTDNLINQHIDKPSVEVYNLLLRHFSQEEIHGLTLAIKQIDNWTIVMKTYKKEM